MSFDDLPRTSDLKYSVKVVNPSLISTNSPFNLLILTASGLVWKTVRNRCSLSRKAALAHLRWEISVINSALVFSSSLVLKLTHNSSSLLAASRTFLLCSAISKSSMYFFKVMDMIEAENPRNPYSIKNWIVVIPRVAKASWIPRAAHNKNPKINSLAPIFSRLFFFSQ